MTDPGVPRTDPRVLRSRAAVLGATLELLVEKGIAATTIEAVSERSGVAKTTIYRQWEDQPALVHDAFATTLVEPPDPDTGTLRGDLVALLTGLAGALTRGPAAALMPALIEAAERDPAFAELHRREAEQRHRVVRGVIERGISRGELPAGTETDDVLDLLTGPLFHRRWVSGGVLDGGFAALVVDVVLAGCGAPQPRAPQSSAQPRFGSTRVC